MGLATLCIHVYKASQAMKGSFSRPKGLISVEGSGHTHHFTVMLMTVCSLLFGRQVAAAEVLKGVQQF